MPGATQILGTRDHLLFDLEQTLTAARALDTEYIPNIPLPLMPAHTTCVSWADLPQDPCPLAALLQDCPRLGHAQPAPKHARCSLFR